MNDPWCVLLASRLTPEYPEAAAFDSSPGSRQPLLRDPLNAAWHRAAGIVSRDRIVAVIAGHAGGLPDNLLKDLDARNLFVQPQHRGTGYEVLLALLQLENRISPSTPVLFLPADCVVDNEEVMACALTGLVEWIANEPRPVYLLGTVPQGPHDQLGYIVPWHDAMHMPTSVYEFVEKPDVREARKLINAGGLWNTFIFGGTLSSLIKLFHPRCGATISALSRALRAGPDGIEVLSGLYDRLPPLDFSKHVLARQTANLHVLRLPRCGWWPLKAPNLDRQLRERIPAGCDSH